MSDLLNSASLIMIPSGYKEDILYSEIPTNGSGDMAFTRASNGTRVNSAGLVEVCPWNLVQQSESIGTSPWLTNGATLTSGQTDPSGGTTAVKVELASGGNNYVYQGITLPNPINIVSAYLRADSATTIGFSMGGSTPNAVNLTTTWQLFTFSSADTSGGIIFDNYFGPSPTQQAKTFYIWHPQLNIGSTAKPYFPTTDRLNVPRLTYQNGGGGCPSLLLEKQSTNYIPYSEDYTNAAWTKNGISITANDTTSPDGTQNADKLTSNDPSGSVYRIYETATTPSDSVCSVSCYFKYDNWQYAFIVADNYSGVGRYAVFDLINATNTYVSSGYTATISSVGNGWYKCTITGEFGINAYCQFGLALTSTTYNGASIANGKNLYVWGTQREQSSYPTSYIPTTSSSATRVADVCSKSGISSLIGQTEGVLFVDFVFTAYDSQAKWIAFLGGGSYYIGLYTDGSSHFVAEVYDNNFSFLNQTFTFSVGTRYKLALAYKTNDFAFYVNGTQVATDNSGTVPATSQFSFEYNSTANNNTSRTYNQAILFKTRLTNAELASLTTI